MSFSTNLSLITFMVVCFINCVWFFVWQKHCEAYSAVLLSENYTVSRSWCRWSQENNTMCNHSNSNSPFRFTSSVITSQFWGSSLITSSTCPTSLHCISSAYCVYARGTVPNWKRQIDLNCHPTKQIQSKSCLDWYVAGMSEMSNWIRFDGVSSMVCCPSY